MLEKPHCKPAFSSGNELCERGSVLQSADT